MSSIAHAQPPFFRTGDGKIKLKNTHNGREISITYVNADGTLNEAAYQQIDSVFGFPTKEKGENISRRLISLLDHFVDEIDSEKVIYITSGYRSPAYNQKLRDRGKTAAKSSTHIDGMALDFYLEGRTPSNAKALWEKIRALDCCGVGHYGGKNIHLDAGRPRFWQQATAKVNTGDPAHNRFIYYSTDYDRYKAGDAFRSFLTSISDFGFGIKNKLEIVTDEEKPRKVAKVKIATSHKKSCLDVTERKAARFIKASFPDNIKPGRYRVKVSFCDRQFEDMPEDKLSNPVEIVAQ